MTDTNALSLLYAQGGLPRYLAEINRFPMLKAEGLRFAIREGGHTVGAGTVSKIIK